MHKSSFPDGDERIVRAYLSPETRKATEKKIFLEWYSHLTADVSEIGCSGPDAEQAFASVMEVRWPRVCGLRSKKTASAQQSGQESNSARAQAILRKTGDLKTFLRGACLDEMLILSMLRGGDAQESALRFILKHWSPGLFKPLSKHGLRQQEFEVLFGKAAQRVEQRLLLGAYCFREPGLCDMFFDETIVAAVLEGGRMAEAALAFFYDHTNDEWHKYLLKPVLSDAVSMPEDAEDVLQDLLSQLSKRLTGENASPFMLKNALRTYLYSCAMRAWWKLKKTFAPQTLPEKMPPPENDEDYEEETDDKIEGQNLPEPGQDTLENPDPDSEAVGQGQSKEEGQEAKLRAIVAQRYSPEIVREEFERFGERDKMVFRLADEGYHDEEIGEKMGIQAQAVRNRRNRALRRLTRKLLWKTMRKMEERGLALAQIAERLGLEETFFQELKKKAGT